MAETKPRLQVKRLLVPIDFSEPSLKALKYAVRLAEQFGASICLAHIVEKPRLPDLVVQDEDLTIDAKAKLAAFALDEIPELVPVSVQTRIGKPAEGIVILAKGRQIDLIVIGTHGRTGLKHALLGSTAEQVIRHACCPVLVVREQEHEFI